MDHQLIVVTFLLWVTGAPVGHVLAARAAEIPEVPAMQLLYQAGEESRWLAPGRLVAQRTVGGRRVGGVARTLRGSRGPYFCGALQLKRRTAQACEALNASLSASYGGAVAHLLAWRDLCLRAGRATAADWRTCALAGYAGGNGATTNRRSRGHRYAVRVLRSADTAVAHAVLRRHAGGTAD